MSLDVNLFIEVDTGDYTNLFSANITHNLGEMAAEAGIYKALWRPEKTNAVFAKDIIKTLEEGLEKMKKNPELFKAFDSLNGWGTYEQFIPWIKEYLEACKRHPKAKIEVWR